MHVIVGVKYRRQVSSGAGEDQLEARGRTHEVATPHEQGTGLTQGLRGRLCVAGMGDGGGIQAGEGLCDVRITVMVVGVERFVGRDQAGEREEEEEERSHTANVFEHILQRLGSTTATAATATATRHRESTPSRFKKPILQTRIGLFSYSPVLIVFSCPRTAFIRAFGKPGQRRRR